MASGGVDDTRVPGREEDSSAVPPGPLDDASLIRLLRELPDVVIVVGGSGRVLWGNVTAEQLFGRSLDSAMGMSGLELVHPEDLELVLRSLGSIQAKIVGTPIEIRLNTAGGWRLMELVGAPVPWFEDGAVLLSLRDLTDRRRFEIAHDRDGRFRSLVQNAAVVTMLVEPNGTITSCSGAVTRMLGHDPEQVEGRPLLQLVSEEDRHAVAEALERAARGAAAASPVTVTVGLLRHGGDTAIPFELALVNLVDDPTVGGYVVSGHDVTDRKRLEDQLSHQAFHDSLTGLGNRALFQDRLAHALEHIERVRGQLAVLFIDMDNLKTVNDRLGHAVGDSLLQVVANNLVSCTRKADTAARLGGDEFGVIVQEFARREAVETLAQRILEGCRRPLSVGGTMITATVSIGFTFSRPGMTVDGLLSNADQAMYAAKSRGKDRYEMFQEGTVRRFEPAR
jgi:diguanylate cyclase (GGDEF)-like protein/PAS domain S-box-containing protein